MNAHYNSCSLEPPGNERFGVKLQKGKLFKASKGKKLFFFFPRPPSSNLEQGKGKWTHHTPKADAGR